MEIKAKQNTTNSNMVDTMKLEIKEEHLLLTTSPDEHIFAVTECHLDP